MLLRSEPAGALVYLDGRRIGKTPRDEPFLWYGTRRAVVIAEGHAPVDVEIPLRPPLYEIPPLDLIFGLLPFTFHDTTEVTVVLPALEEETVKAVLERAAAYRGVE
ncbi:MAG: PEGA domain-containing protein [Planctomycetota bacterium]|nr:PEGA domain-containing protein [Planctomycetota bacterium]